MLRITDFKLYSSLNTVLTIEEIYIDEGTFIHIQGKNSTGKSLFLKSLCGQYKNYSGSLLYRRKKLSENKMNNNVVLISNYFPVIENLSFLENIQLPIGNINSIQRSRLIDMATILGVVNDLNDMMELSSRTQRLLVYLIRASLLSPSILLIDDIDTYFDDSNYEKVYQFFQFCLKSGMMIISTGKTPIENIQNYVIRNGVMEKI